MNTFLKENSDFIHRTALVSSIARDEIKKVQSKLASDERIAYDYMKQFPNFLSKVEGGLINTAPTFITREVAKDLSKFSGGNDKVTNEYLNDKEFIKSLVEINRHMKETYKNTEILENSFGKSGYPIDQKGVVKIIHKLEMGKYEPFSEKFEKELKTDLEEVKQSEQTKAVENKTKIKEFEMEH